MLHERQYVEVERDDLESARVAIDPEPRLEEGQARLRIESFALTSNNVTYAAFGGPMRYWDFFPSSEPAWGRVPVWGFGQVVESHSDAVVIGERVYGYFPMGSELVVTPGRSDAAGFSDLAEHRQPMAPVYNRYQRVADEPDEQAEAIQMVLYPLFVTAFLIADAIADDEQSASSSLIVSSASSKTSISLAYAAKQQGLATIGLTSSTNRQMVEGLGLFDEVVTYDEIADHLPTVSTAPYVYVDIAGNTAVTAAVHRCLGADLVRSIVVGNTHWDQRVDDIAVDGVAREFFFAPDRITKRTKDWGREELDRRMLAAWDGFVESTRPWLQIDRVVGADAVSAAWVNLVAGRSDPAVGIVGQLSLGAER
jgi:hypothetical protein